MLKLKQENTIKHTMLNGVKLPMMRLGLGVQRVYAHAFMSLDQLCRKYTEITIKLGEVGCARVDWLNPHLKLNYE